MKFGWKILKNVEFCILLYYAGESVTTFPHSGNAFPFIIQKYSKLANFTGLCFPHFRVFCNQTTQLCEIWDALPAVLIDSPNSKVCLKGEWSIDANYIATVNYVQYC